MFCWQFSYKKWCDALANQFWLVSNIISKIEFLIKGANRFEYGLQESLSLMVNYRYYLDDIWTNAHNYQLDRTVPISENVHVL